MLQKMFLSVEEYMPVHRSLAVVLLVDNLEEVAAATEILKSHTHKFQGLQLKSSLFSTLSLVQLEEVKAVSIVLEDVLCLDDIFKNSQGKYVELIVAFRLFSADLLKRCERVDRVIVSFSCEEELLGLNEMFKAFITLKRFPLTLNVPLCKIDVKHAAEIYMRKDVGKGIGKRREGVKPTTCSGCLLQQYCAFAGNGFIPVPIVDSEKYAGVLVFLANEDSTARF